MITSEKGRALIQLLEGFREKAYKCSAGKWTIGYGITKNVKEGDVVTKEKAEQDFSIHVQAIENFLNTVITAPLNQNQFDALVSFVYNVGETAFHGSQVMQLVNHSCYEAMPMHLARWIWTTVNGEKVQDPGLIRRRRIEGELWRRPIESTEKVDLS